MVPVLFPSPGNERAFAIDDVDFLFLQLDDVCCSWAIVEVLEELLQGIFRALSFPFNLASSAPETVVCKPTKQALTLLFGVFSTNPVRPYLWALDWVNDLSTSTCFAMSRERASET
jgi:hypothetical protein